MGLRGGKELEEEIFRASNFIGPHCLRFELGSTSSFPDWAFEPTSSLADAQRASNSDFQKRCPGQGGEPGIFSFICHHMIFIRTASIEFLRD